MTITSQISNLVRENAMLGQQAMHGPMSIQGLIPIVVEKSQSGERSWDIFSRLMKERIIFIGEGIDDYMANIVMAQLLFCHYDAKDKDIQVYINSPGGVVTAGLGIYDTMQFVSCDVATYCLGQAASMGAVLLAAGTAGKRYALPNARIMIHQPLGGAYGQASDIEIRTKEINRLKTRLYEILCKHSGQDPDTMEKACDRDNFMGANEAKEFGLVDHVITNASATFQEEDA